MGLGVIVHNTHIVNTVGTVLPEVTDQEVSLLFCGLWRRCTGPISRTYGPGWLSLSPLHRATYEDEGVVAYVSGGEGFARQVCDPVPELVMTRRNEAVPLAIKGMTLGEFGVAAVTVIWEVWGI